VNFRGQRSEKLGRTHRGVKEAEPSIDGLLELWRSAGRQARRRRASGGASSRALVGRLRRPNGPGGPRSSPP